jgi:hypothetical protein
LNVGQLGGEEVYDLLDVFGYPVNNGLLFVWFAGCQYNVTGQTYLQHLLLLNRIVLAQDREQPFSLVDIGSVRSVSDMSMLPDVVSIGPVAR